MDTDRQAVFLDKARKKYGDLYDLSQVVYGGAHENIIIGCKVHGSVTISATNFLRGHGCPKCSREKVGISKRNSQETFLERTKAAHGDKYGYSKAVYTGGHHKVIIVCPIHGDFQIRPFLLWAGSGCPKCARKRCGRKPKQKLED